MTGTQRPLSLVVNGDEVTVLIEDSWTLLYLLRETLDLPGTKHGCGSGTCGACTVLMDGQAINSCLVLAAECEGTRVLTVEGLADDNDLHAVQKAFIEKHAMQCGFCTPGMIMSTVALLGEKPEPTEEDIVRALVGNLCRCGSYPKIREAVKAVAKSYAEAQLAPVGS